MFSKTADPSTLYFNQEVTELLRNKLTSRNPEIQAIINHLFARRGKQFRPTLIYLCSSLNQGDIEDTKKIAVAVEMIHLASLVHDDIIDNSSYRRGIQTVNNKWENKTGVLIGDHLFARAFTILTPYEPLGILSVFTRAISKMCQGELIQLHNNHNINITADTYFKIIEYKTASLLAACCEAGSLIAKAPLSHVRSLKSFGLHLGISYQIIDDIIDYIADASSNDEEKPRGKDIKEGTVTLPLIYLLQDNPDAFNIKELWDGEVTKKDINTLIKTLNKYSCIDKAIQKAESEITKAQNSISKLPDTQEKELLMEISRKVTKQLEKYRQPLASK